LVWGYVLVWLWPATKAPCGRPSPPPGCGGEWKERGRNWWVGIRAVLTEQQTKGTGTTTIQIRGTHKTNQQNRAHRTEPLSWTGPPLSPRAASEFPPPAPPYWNPA